MPFDYVYRISLNHSGTNIETIAFIHDGLKVLFFWQQRNLADVNFYF